MKILVLNSGSSSIKCQYFIDQKSVSSALVERIGEEESHSEVKYKEQSFSSTAPVSDHHQALEIIFSMLKESNAISSIDELDAVGHRVVHGGSNFSEPTLISQEVIETIRSLIPLAPLHNPANLKGIEVISKIAPNLAQVAVFDTAFHQTMPEYAALYPIPYELSQRSGIQRYGFHGTSHAYVAKEAAEMMDEDLNTLNLITLHLGNGASATAIKEGKSIETSMGLTPLEGLMMGTRCGDIDPAIIPFLSHNLKMDIDSIDKMLNKESGLKGICGTNDMREVVMQAEQDNTLSSLALEMYTYRIKKYIGSYSAVLGRVDAIIFTGGIGEHAVKVREMVCEGLEESIGLKLDTVKNEIASTQSRSIHKLKSKIQLFVIPTNEELEIVLQTEKIMKNLTL
ncbi:acetate/propionate family kinase [Sulfurovum sp. CS9]|uniref:acetate/propionate family kinase n=1 Tax=Sulfurovum sp. CS9 TaxID=3391146 RepID=UPI0039ED66CE